MVYLDYAANTPVDKEVLEVFNKITLEYFGNPNSVHNKGLEAKERINESSKIIGNYFHTEPKNIIYTSGSSEANNLVIKGIADRYNSIGRHIIISESEHSSIIAPCNYLASKGYEISVIPLNEFGNVDIKKLKDTIREDTILVSICAVESELGTINPIKEISEIVSKYPNCFFHTDATQAIGKVDIDYLGVDFLTFAPHKFNGLNGTGILINFNDLKLTPLIHGGKSTTIYRSGTPNTAQCVATSFALDKALKKIEANLTYINELKQYLIKELSKLEYVHLNIPKNSVVNILNFSLKNIDADEVVKNLSDKEIYVSRKSACSSSLSMSKPVYALTKDEMLAKNSIRVSLSKLTTKHDIDVFLETLKQIVKEVK